MKQIQQWICSDNLHHLHHLQQPLLRRQAEELCRDLSSKATDLSLLAMMLEEKLWEKIV